jgi:hypothetical protein
MKSKTILIDVLPCYINIYWSILKFEWIFT